MLIHEHEYQVDTGDRTRQLLRDPNPALKSALDSCRDIWGPSAADLITLIESAQAWPDPPTSDEALAAVRAELRTGTLSLESALPIAATQQRWREWFDLRSSMIGMARELATESRNTLVSCSDQLFTALNDQLQALLNDLPSREVWALTAEEAIAQGKSDEWQHCNQFTAQYRKIRAGQARLYSYLHPELEQQLRNTSSGTVSAWLANPLDLCPDLLIGLKFGHVLRDGEKTGVRIPWPQAPRLDDEAQVGYLIHNPDATAWVPTTTELTTVLAAWWETTIALAEDGGTQPTQAGMISAKSLNKRRGY